MSRSMAAAASKSISSSRINSVLSRPLHYDIFELKQKDREGNKYQIIIVDEASDYIWVRHLKSKSETILELQSLVIEIEKHTGYKAKELLAWKDTMEKIYGKNYDVNDDIDEKVGGVAEIRSDGAGENRSHEWRKWAKQRGIRLEFSVAHNQEQDGKS